MVLHHSTLCVQVSYIFAVNCAKKEKKANTSDSQVWFPSAFYFSYDYFTTMLPTAIIHCHSAQARSQDLQSHFTLNPTHLLITTSNINMEQNAQIFIFSVWLMGMH